MEARVALRLAHWADGRRKEAEARLKDLQVPSPVSLAKSLCPLELGEREDDGRCRDVRLPQAPPLQQGRAENGKEHARRPREERQREAASDHGAGVSPDP